MRAERLAGAREERQRREQATLARRRRRCDELERAVADENLELNEAERHLRTTRSLLGNLGRLPTRDDRDALTARLRAVQVGFVGRVRELRGLAEWKQWANLGVQAALCQRLEALASVDDEAVVAEEYRQIMLSWRQASEVQRGEGDEVFLRFKAAHDAIRPKAAAYLARQEARRQECLDQKVTLCEEAERLAVSTDWIATAQRMTELQAAWKQIGPATRKQEREVWNRFRAASGQFFKRPARGSGATQTGLGPERRIEGRIVPEGRGVVRGKGHRGSKGAREAAPGRMERGRASPAESLGGDVDTVPGRL